MVLMISVGLPVIARPVSFVASGETCLAFRLLTIGYVASANEIDASCIVAAFARWEISDAHTRELATKDLAQQLASLKDGGDDCVLPANRVLNEMYVTIMREALVVPSGCRGSI